MPGLRRGKQKSNVSDQITERSPRFRNVSPIEPIRLRIALSSLHHVGTMDFDRVLNGVQVAGNLFVQFASDNVFERFPLTRCERGQARAVTCAKRSCGTPRGDA